MSVRHFIGLASICVSFWPTVATEIHCGAKSARLRTRGWGTAPFRKSRREASAWSRHDHGTVDCLVQAGVRAVHLRLEDHGLRGNGHLMMQERNSDDIAAFLERWISEYVGSRPT